MKALSAKEMAVLAVVGWTSALVMVGAAIKLGGAARAVAVVWVLGATVWTFLTGLRFARERG